MEILSNIYTRVENNPKFSFWIMALSLILSLILIIVVIALSTALDAVKDIELNGGTAQTMGGFGEHMSDRDDVMSPFAKSVVRYHEAADPVDSRDVGENEEYLNNIAEHPLLVQKLWSGA